MTNEFCESCRFWNPWTVQPETGPRKGECRFDAPQAFQHPQTGVVQTKWPSTAFNFWCGQHGDKP